MKKGRVAINKLILGIVAVVVLIMVIMGVTGQFNKFYFWADLFPGFEEDFPEEEAILGYNLEKGELSYYTGTKWKEIDTSNEVFVLGDYEFYPPEVKNNFREFYIGERRPERLVLEVSKFKVWVVSAMSNNFINEILKSNYVGADLYDYHKDNKIRRWFATMLHLDYSGVLSKAVSSDTYDGTTTDFFRLTSKDLKIYNPLIEKANSWRDQFLKGNVCEKFLKLKIGDRDINYHVERIEDHIYVELTLPVYLGTSEKWQNESCFSVPEIKDTSDWVNYATVEFNYIEDPVFGIKGDAKFVWTPLIDKFGNSTTGGWYRENRKSTITQFPLSFLSFYEGLKFFSKEMNLGENDHGLKVYIYEGENKISPLRVNEEIINSEGYLMDEDLFVDLIMLKYNEYLKELTPEEPSNLK